MNSELLKQAIVSQRTVFLKTEGFIARDALKDRHFDTLCNIKEAIVITGVRRSGKSYLMRLIWKKIFKQKKTSRDNFLYFNFEDEKLLDFKAKDFSLLLESFFELYAVDRKQTVYLFFDEIQNIVGWDKFINRLLEDGGYKIFITGSNATLLSKELSTSLTGRSFPVTLYPLSFKEFVAWKLPETITPESFYRDETRIRLKQLFREYKENGGFPEVVLQSFRPLLQEYMKNILYRDIVARYRIRHEASLRELSAFVVSHIGTPLSLEQIAKMTRIKSLMTVKNYLSYLGNSYLFFPVAKYSHSIKQQIYNPDKTYVIDTGLYHEIAFTTSENEGRILENMVYLELRRRGRSVFYHRGKKSECDFVVKEKNAIVEAVQVTKLLDDRNTNRELDGLADAMQAYALREGLILTEDGGESREKDGMNIRVRPIWEWLLSA